ncbi:hypothetical protein AVEN_31073-1 [Araneus ventricosus]|uniref:DUF5641 domain-containing protein n=1 Tax=Araneus ventricosus TaxID=182803 RepID=A0A4Y2MQ73_ARAVE|nr:hypothetical protein AVEN_31073-1 [Araneus ventricosus]
MNKPVFYMPHQPVFRDESLTIKMRIVFDASSNHSFQHLSLNDCLWPGPNLNSNIFDILINFRLNKFAIISDLEKAFLQLTLAEKDRDAVRFLWTENDTLQVYGFNRVLFGVRSSPFLLSASIKTHLKKFHDEFPTTTECLNRCFDVDDFVSGADSLQDALEISTQAVSIIDQASMVLRKWTTNSDELRQLWKREGLENQLQDNPISPRVNSTKVLGILWNTAEDHLIVGTQSLLDSLSNNENTERHLLRTIGKIFDPLGLLTPFTIRVKCILQVLWMKEISWDEELSPDIQNTWCQWVSEVPRLSELQVPRYVLISTGEQTDVLELHCFRDASQKAYGVVIYTRVVKDCNVEVNLLVLKSRVVPLTKITMPRLELLGALLAARLASKVKAIVDLKRPSQVFFWTDSKITLHWIKGSSKRWKAFVSNRVTEIQSLCDTSAWAHCPGKQNPADFLSRGVNVEILLNSDLWWKGPQFLREVDFPTDTGNDDTSISLHDISDELKKTSDYSPLTFTVLNHNSFIDDILKISNNYMSIIRVVCYVLRFIHNVKNIERLAGDLTIKELQRAEIYLVQLVQQEENIEWSFIPPRSPNWGGLWEANIKAFKYHFKLVAGNSKFSYEELLTLTTQIEAILSSRSLTSLSADVDDREVLTPAHFLIGRPITAIVEPSLVDFETNRFNVWQRITKSVQTIWKRWSLFYLNGLQQRKKWVVNNENLKIGDMVLIREENLSPCKWLMGRVIALYPGRDNKVRVVDVNL